jgi:Spy/CpxP family protein refolding chaperone
VDYVARAPNSLIISSRVLPHHPKVRPFSSFHLATGIEIHQRFSAFPNFKSVEEFLTSRVIRQTSPQRLINQTKRKQSFQNSKESNSFAKEGEINVKPNWKRIIVTTIAGAVLLAASVVAFSQRPGGSPQGPGPGGGFRGGPDGGPQGPPRGEGFRGGPGGPRDGLGPMERDLNLSDDQRSRIRTIQEGFRESEQALHEQMRALSQNQADPFGAEFNEAAVRLAAEARAKIQVELEVSRARMMSQIGLILTDDQKAQLAARRQQFRRQGPPPPPQDQP